jgi:hypothetical protein
MEVVADHLMRLLVRVRDPARQLRQRRLGHRTRPPEHRRWIVAGLELETGHVDRLAIEPARRARLQAREREAEICERVREAD